MAVANFAETSESMGQSTWTGNVNYRGTCFTRRIDFSLKYTGQLNKLLNNSSGKHSRALFSKTWLSNLMLQRFFKGSFDS